MGTDITEYHEPHDGKANAPARARLRWSWGKASMEVDAEITPTALFAIGGMVGLILLAVVPIVSAGGKAKRRF
jgi:hypothetical protein